MKTRKALTQQTLVRLARLYEYAGGDVTDGEDEMRLGTGTGSTARGDQQRTAEAERLLGRMVRAHEGVPGADE